MTLEEKYFRRLDVFDGDRAKFRNWLWDLTVAIGQIDIRLSEELKSVTKKVREDKWSPELDPEVDKAIYEKYTGELYGVLWVDMRGGEWGSSGGGG